MCLDMISMHAGTSLYYCNVVADSTKMGSLEIAVRFYLEIMNL